MKNTEIDIVEDNDEIYHQKYQIKLSNIMETVSDGQMNSEDEGWGKIIYNTNSNVDLRKIETWLELCGLNDEYYNHILEKTLVRQDLRLKEIGSDPRTKKERGRKPKDNSINNISVKHLKLMKAPILLEEIKKGIFHYIMHGNKKVYFSDCLF